MTFVAVSDKDRALGFYRDKLGLNFIEDDGFALVFELGGAILLRVVPGLQVPQVGYTILGWQVSDVRVKVMELREAGIACEKYSFLPQDEDGIWASPSGAGIAWFKDPDGNTLSLAQL